MKKKAIKKDIICSCGKILGYSKEDGHHINGGNTIHLYDDKIKIKCRYCGKNIIISKKIGN